MKIELAGGALLDSGANSHVKYVKDLPEDLINIPLTIANNESIPCAATIGPKGTPLVYIVGESDTEILPLGWLIERHCIMSPDFSLLTTPRGTQLQVHLRDQLPFITKKDLITLFEDLPEPEEPGRSGEATNLTVNVVCSMRLRASVVQTSGGEGWSCHVQDAAGWSCDMQEAAGLRIVPSIYALASFGCVASSLL